MCGSGGGGREGGWVVVQVEGGRKGGSVVVEMEGGG